MKAFIFLLRFSIFHFGLTADSVDMFSVAVDIYLSYHLFSSNKKAPVYTIDDVTTQLVKRYSLLLERKLSDVCDKRLI